MVAKTPGNNAAKLRSQANPLTGEQPNSFTNVTNRTLANPVASREQAPLPANETRRLRSAQRSASRTDLDPSTGKVGANAPQLGYQRPEGMSEASHGWLMGAHHMFPNVAAEQSGAAINEPHELGPGVTAQRRAEDLSGPEYRKGVATLRNYGYGGRDPVGELTANRSQVTERVIGEHVAAGMQESASQHFYGGSPITSHISNDAPGTPAHLSDQAPRSGYDLQQTHNASMREVSGLMTAATARLESHPEYQRRTAELSPEERHQGARNATVQATADTSPQNKFFARGTKRSPNMEQAVESTTAAMENRDPKLLGGLPENTEKAKARTQAMFPEHSGGENSWPEGTHGHEANGGGSIDLNTHQFGDPVSAIKTVAFRGAFSEPNSPGAFKVSDVMEAGTMLPGASPAKSKMYQGSKGQVALHADDNPSKVSGMSPIMKTDADGETHPKLGASRAEQMLSDSKGTAHTLNDYATRQSNTAYGLSRGVNYADNIHPVQAAAWGSHQVHRGDVAVSHADQYPVVRDWSSEGHSDMTPVGQSLFGGPMHHMGPQFRANPNTVGKSKSGENDVSRNKPYPVMQGE